MTLVFEPLRTTMNRDAFSCGEPALDTYLHQQARQDMARGFATVIAACAASAPETILGFYTLCAASVPLTDIPENLRQKMPRYHSVPAICLGRLAVAAEFQCQRTGTLLLIDAMARACRTELAWMVFYVDAKNERVENFYTKMFFKPFHDKPHSLWMHREQASAIVKNLSR